MLKKQNIYIETSVISYLVSRPNENLVLAAYQQITRNWWETDLFIRHKINKINSELGIDTPEICTPEELFKDKI